MPTSSNTTRIAKNTLLLYFRMLLTMGVSLYTSRVILNALGVEDYGIYNVVGGVVAMFGILSGSLSSAISRFITFELGKGDLEKLKRIFCTSVNIQVILIAIISILMETIGIWFLNNKMIIPEQRLAAANWVFQFSVVTFALNLLSVPYNAVIIAHEKMSAFAYISIVDVTLKLIVAFIIAYNPFDKLVYYGLLIMICGVINRSIYAIYSKRHFEEATYRMIFDKGLMKEMFGFAKWEFFGNASALVRDQGGNILINLFFGPAVNAARGIAMQINNATQMFVNNFTTAVNPQITKCYAAGDVNSAIKLVFRSAKFSFFIVLLIALPILMTTPYLLELWLAKVPDYTVEFVRLSMIFVMSETLTKPLITLILATGHLKKIQLLVGCNRMLINFPLLLLCLYLGATPEYVFIFAIIDSFICEITRLIILMQKVNFPAKEFLKKIYIKTIIVAAIASVLPLSIKKYCYNDLTSFLIITIVSIVSVALIAYGIGCDKEEKKIVINIIKSLKQKFLKL